MISVRTITIFAALVTQSFGYTPCSNTSCSKSVLGTSTSTRREHLSNIAFGLLTVTGTPSIAQALEACPPKANNCVRTKWTPPTGTSKSDSILSLREALNAYPQEGQANVDGGGWTIAEDNFDGLGTARIEYRSSGKGNFAKFFNGGKPFVDDLKLEVGDNGIVEVKSQSRVGDSDFGVNQKRVDYIAAALSSKGWSI
mmetsp:Transcript_22767/g.32119  ORF Transcript_22767/g.32119 Transcript_22767/m.32119 type:complete len:198 (+) Transcript_22767:51-644(+)|eukprot:CAMPEP_0184860054 /NCGR_PEP_ID=MMETSP0580-20130426/5006_1 /TAXON_ID=1118495 /ORGANISM="Dactyliosolen fragilissimus" /LENGTH=197 /DNA_ID=CAMNT_0027357005 /DNA_START=16 /DNA_END=609 /DNA_ORIENTATION=-